MKSVRGTFGAVVTEVDVAKMWKRIDAKVA
ncbi:hypothetical protein J2S98_003816 [Arthrobacter oryzae]|nr:hypothetical protein [Arthrobacter oryzae]